MKGLEIFIQYGKNGKVYRSAFSESCVQSDFSAEVIRESGNPERFQLTITPSSEMEILQMRARFDFSYQDDQRIFVNGYQSWTDSRELAINEKLRGIPWYAAPILPKYQIHKYGDYTFHRYPKRKGVFHGYTYSYIRSGKRLILIGSLSERNGFTVIKHDVKHRTLTFEKDCVGFRISGPYMAFDMAWIEGNENFVFDSYFEMMKIPKPKTRPMTGWTSWYNYYQNINEEIILDNLGHFQNKDQKIDIFQIDDGYQTAVGDWLSMDSVKFPQGMKFVAEQIHGSGFRAGLWLAPFACETRSALFRDHPDWVLKDSKGRPLLAGSNWSRFYALDFYHPEVRKYLKQVFSVVLNEWGYDLVKLDFLYAVCLPQRTDRTRGQIMTEAMDFLRECVGDKLILGCGVPLGPAFGRVDYCRIGCDVGLDWNDKSYMRHLLRERISTFNAIGNAIGRRQLDGRAFLNDPDVFLLRDENLQLTSAQKNTLLTANTTFGSLLFTSDNIGHYNTKQQQCLEAAFLLGRKHFERVERDGNGLVEIIYSEDGEKHLILMNLGAKALDLRNYWGRLGEIRLGQEDLDIAPKENLHLAAYESRSYKFLSK